MTIVSIIILSIAALCLVTMAASVLFLLVSESGFEDTNMLRSARLLALTLIASIIGLGLTVLDGLVITPPLPPVQFYAWTVSVFAIISIVVAGPIRLIASCASAAVHAGAIITVLVHRVFF